MAKVLVMEGESIDEALKRFGIQVRKEKVLSVLKEKRFYRTKSEKRRLKTKLARKRIAKIRKKLRELEIDPDYKPWSKDIDWDSLDMKAPIEEESSAYVACILEYDDQLVLVKTISDKKSRFKEERFGFPGGSVDTGETIYSACVREVWEETGFYIAPPSDKDLVLKFENNKHSKYFFRGMVIGGAPICGDEIAIINVGSPEEVQKMAESGFMRPAHRDAFYRYLQLNGENSNVI